MIKAGFGVWENRSAWLRGVCSRLLSFPPTLLAILYAQSRGTIFGGVAAGVTFGMKFVKSKILLAGFGVIAAAGLYFAMDAYLVSVVLTAPLNGTRAFARSFDWYRATDHPA